MVAIYKHFSTPTCISREWMKMSNESQNHKLSLWNTLSLKIIYIKKILFYWLNKTLPKFNKFLVIVLITQDFKECNYGKA